jgi:hypothetical protein
VADPFRQDSRTAGAFPVTRTVLAAGYLALAVGVLAARGAPAPGYEPSVYTGTPPVYWVCVLVAVSVGVGAAFLWGRLGRYAGVALAGLSVLSFVGLPVVRGYHFHGAADAMTHLGYAREMAGESQLFFDLIYPGGHAMGVFLSGAMDVPVRQGLMYTMVAVAAVTLLFVPLCVWVVVREPRAVVFGAVTAMLMLPINNVSTTYAFHTFSLATFFFPFVLYLALKHVLGGAEDRSLPRWLSGVSLVAPVPLVAVVLFHPQLAVDVIIVLGTVAVTGVVLRAREGWWGNGSVRDAVTDGGGDRHRLLVGQVVVLVAVFVVWVLQHEQTYIFAESLTESLGQFFAEGEGAAAVTQDRQQSADRLGISLVELFVKLFAANLLYVVAAAGLAVATLLGLAGESGSDERRVVLYVVLSGLALAPFVLAQFVGNISGYFFRHFGFVMVLVGLLGAIALYRFLGRVGPQTVTSTRGLVLSVCAVVVLCLSLAAFFPSPYIYLPGQGTPEQQFTGFETSFEHLPEEAAMAKIRPGTGRMQDATGYVLADDRSWLVQGPTLDSLGNVTRFRGDAGPDYGHPGYYLVVSEYDRLRETVGFHGIRFQDEDFGRVTGTTTPRLTPVVSNGDYRLYYVDQRGIDIPAPQQIGELSPRR